MIRVRYAPGTSSNSERVSPRSSETVIVRTDETEFVPVGLSSGTAPLHRGTEFPIRRFLRNGGRTAEGLQAFRPGFPRCRFRRQIHRLVPLDLFAGALQILQQDAPGNAVDNQMVNREQQTVRFGTAQTEQGRAHERTPLEMQTGLHRRRALLNPSRAGGFRPRTAIGFHDGNRGRTGLDFLTPAFRGADEPGTQIIVMAQEMFQGFFQNGNLQRLVEFQQNGLIPMVGIRQFLFEKPMLDGRQRDRAAHNGLLRARLFHLSLDSARQGGDGGVFENRLRRQRKPRPFGARKNLDAQNRIAAAFEKVVVNAHAFQSEHPRPNRGQPLLEFGARRYVIIRGSSPRLRQRQRLAVHLAVHRQWKRLQRYERLRDHVIRQKVSNVFLENLRRNRTGFEDVRNQPFGAAFAGPHQHERRLHARVPAQRAFDFAQFHPEAAEFDLIVAAAEIIQIAAGKIAD